MRLEPRHMRVAKICETLRLEGCRESGAAPNIVDGLTRQTVHEIEVDPVNPRAAQLADRPLDDLEWLDTPNRLLDLCAEILNPEARPVDPDAGKRACEFAP